VSRKVRIGELKQYLGGGRSIHTIYKDVQYNRIPFERLGRTLFFDLDKIDVWMKCQGNGDAIELESSRATEEQAARPEEAARRQGRGKKRPPGGSPAQREEAKRISSEIMAGE
jgi:hypothetical protein